MTPALPPFKFPGSKRRLLPTLLPILGDPELYVEPFLGGGAVFYALGPRRALLSDIDATLVRAHRECDDADTHRRLDEHRRTAWTQARYARVQARASHGLSWGWAGDFIAVQQSAFNGLYRRNRDLDLNAPWGRKPWPALPTPDRLRACAERLARAELVVSSAVDVLGDVGRGAVAYLDPPYVGTFTGYGTGRTFGRSDLEAVIDAAESAVFRGARVVLSHLADDETVARLESTGWTLHEVAVSASIAASGDARSARRELVGVLG